VRTAIPILVGLIFIALGAVYLWSKDYWVDMGMKYDLFWFLHRTDQERLGTERSRILVASIGLMLFGFVLIIATVISAVS